MTLSLALWCLLLLSQSHALLDDRPRIRTEGGHLLLEGAPGKNISFSTRGTGAAVAVNGMDVAETFSLVS
ncbi:hypothetical protein FHG87_001013 [Trinorchestia longiramus]|nr:hypothetical protein FHG87_001013 [Trinorchestia longiramus]